MDPFNLSRYANLTIQRVQPPEEKPPPPTSENEKEMSNNKTDNDGEEEEDEETNKIAAELPDVEDKNNDLVDPVSLGIETDTDAESSATNEVTTTEAEETVEVKQEIQDPGQNSESDGENQDQIDEEIEANSKRKSIEEKDGDQASKKPKMTDEKTSDEDSENQTASEKRLTNLRRNIREVMDENKLDEATLAAQRQEMERLRRVQEQQRLIREVQKQIAINKQNSKAQDRVMSLLQGGTTSLIKKSSVPSDSSVPKPNTIVISTDSGSSQGFNKKMLEILKSHPDSPEQSSGPDKISSIASKLAEANEPHMVTSSVSIAPIKASKVAEVVTISSESDEAEPERPQSSDDDCILISGDEEEEELPDDDANNSGMHTNDAYNQPDEYGRVLVNVGHPDNEPDVFLAPQIARVIKPHQVGGVRFLYDNVVESLERFKSSAGFGCILAHSMGLGKTLQVVSFCDVFLRHTPAKHVLCIMPINTLQNWLAEFNMWLPLADETNSSPSEDVVKKEEVIHRSFPLFVLNDFHKTISARGKVIQSWRNEGGVLLMGYELYRQLTSRKPRKKRNKKQIDEDFFDEKNKPLLDEMREALVKPGPDLVICDEGHRIKNSHASTSQSLKEIESRRRIVLTGYPLQNNLLEYWCMVDFVRPNYLGTKTEFSNMFERPIQNGQCIDSTPQDIRLMRYRAHVLHSLLEGFVQRRSHSVLEKTLPQKEEYVLLVRLTPLQRLLYDRFMNEVVRKKAVPNPLKAFAVCCKIWNHPDILYFFLKKRSLDEAEIDLDLEEAGTPLGTPLGPTPVTSPSAASKRSRNRWPKGGGVNPNSKELKANSNRKNLNKDLRIPAVATVMPNTSSNQIISPTIQNRNCSSVPAHSMQSNNQFDEYSSQSQPQYGIADNFPNQNFNSYNNQNSYWKEGGGEFFRGNPEFYQQGRGSDKKTQYQYPQDPTLEEGEIRLEKSESSYQAYEDNNFRGSNDQGLYQNQAFNQDVSQSRQPEQVQNQGFPQDMHKMNQNHFLNQTTNNETTSFQGVHQRFPAIQPGNTAADQTLKAKGKSIRNRKPSTNKRVPKNQTIQPISDSGNSIENNCGDNINNLGNQQMFSNTKESFRQEFQSQDNSRSNNNLGLLINNQSITTGLSIPLVTNNCDAKFKTSHSSLDSNNKGIYESNLVKQVNNEVSNFESLFGSSNQMLSNHQETNRNNQSVQNNAMKSSMTAQDMTNVNNSNQLGTQNLMMNHHQPIENSRMINNSSLQGNSTVGSSGLLSMHDQSEINSTNSQNTGQHRNHPMGLLHDQEMMMSHHNISFEQKFMNTQQQQQQHQQDKQHQYQNSENTLLNHETTLPVNERFMNSSNSSHNYNNFNILEANQNQSYGSMLPDQQFQSPNILSDQMLHDQEMLLANDQAMLSVLNSTTDANEQALLYNAMVGQSDGQSLLGLLDAPNIMNDQINDYQQPVYGPLPPNIKPGLPGGMKNDPENNQYYRDPKLPHNVGRGVTIMPLGQSSNDVKMYPDQNRYNIPKTPESTYQRYTNYSPMYPYASSSNTPLGSISDILDNIPGPERSYQPTDRKNIAPCTMTSQDINNALPPFHSLDNKPKYDYSESSSNVDIDQSKDEPIPSFSMDNKEGKSSEESTEPPKVPTLLEEGEIRNPSLIMKSGKEEPGIPYDWAVELFKDYIPGMIEASAKMSLLFAIVEESIKIGDRVLLFSQSLFTLDLIEEFLHRNKIPGTDENWCRNCDYYRLDGSTSASEREKLINDFNKCTTVHLFLVSTRAGSLGINLVGANRVIVFDASWNPCHDTQAVCRVYRYGQKKPCYVYRLVTDNCLEKKIYDRQINKQVMADRVVDECNPDAHLSIKEVTNLCWDDGESKPTKDFSSLKDNYDDLVIKHIVENFSSVLTKEPFQHESLFVDRKDKKLSQAEKRLAKRSYEMEKKANSRPMYSYYGQNTNSSLYRNQMGKPMASVRPMQSMSNTSAMMASRNALNRRWIPAEVWQKQGMTAQEMTLPLDVVIPTNAGDRGSIVLKAGQKVMVLKSPKGIYMQLESGKIIAIRTSGNNKPNSPALPGQSFTSQPQSSTTQQQSPMVPPYIGRSHSLDSGFNTAHKNDHSVQQMRNRSNLLRNNPSISITPKHTVPLSRSTQQSPYMAANSHHVPPGSSAISSMQQQQPKLPSSITVTKYDPFSNVQKSSEIGMQSESAGPSYNPRQPSEYPNRPFDRYAPNNRVGYPSSGRLPLPTYPTNNCPPQHPSAPPYHRPP